MKAWGVASGGLLLAAALFTLLLDSPDSSDLGAQQPFPQAAEAGSNLPEPASHIIKGTFPGNSTMQDLLLGQNFTTRVIHQLIEDSREAYNLNRVRAGNDYTMKISPGGRLESFRYEISDEEYLLAAWDGEHYQSSRRAFEFEVKTETIQASIEESLWAALLEAGEKDQLVMDLAWILQWDVDFTTIQFGDELRLVVDKKYRDGQLVKYGEIHAVQFTTGGKDFFAFRFVLPESGQVKYYDQNGKSVKKAFLKVPFRFSPRISSGFSYSRFHPVLKRRTPHLGVDFAAPKGTPVLASANGSVTFAGWKGGLGKFVQLRHPNGYRTGYAHLSRILVKLGQKVSQGDVVGRVGATGLATGAHLDYRVQDPRGRYLNPRGRIAWPSDKPLEERYRSDFAAVRDGLLLQLDPQLVDPGPAQAQSVAE